MNNYIKCTLLILFLLVEFIYSEKINRGFSREFSRKSSLTAKVEKVNGEEVLSIYKKQGNDTIKIIDVKEIFTCRYTLFVDGLLNNNQLVIVFDVDYFFVHVIYENSDGTWIKKTESRFGKMNTQRRQKLCLVECVDLDKVKMHFLKKGEEFMLIRPDKTHRKKGEVKKGDLVDIYQFLSDGTITLNKEPYNFNTSNK